MTSLCRHLSAQEIVNWVTTADGCVHTDDTTKLSPTSCEFVYTPPTRRDSTVSSRRRRRCVLGFMYCSYHSSSNFAMSDFSWFKWYHVGVWFCVRLWDKVKQCGKLMWLSVTFLLRVKFLLLFVTVSFYSIWLAPELLELGLQILTIN